MISSLSYGRFTAGEYDWVGAPARSWRNEGGCQALIYCHGAGQSTLGITKDVDFGVSRLMAEDHVAIMADWGGDAWGNNTATDRVHAAVLASRASFGAQGPVLLAGASMGALTMLNYARRYPENVAAIAAIIPCVNIQSIIDVTGSPASINAAYPPTYGDANQGQTYSPINMAQNGLLPNYIPIKIWSLPTDTLTLPSTQYAFAAAQPQVEIVDITTPGVVHGSGAVAAVQDDVIKWLGEAA